MGLDFQDKTFSTIQKRRPDLIAFKGVKNKRKEQRSLGNVETAKDMQREFQGTETSFDHSLLQSDSVESISGEI